MVRLNAEQRLKIMKMALDACSGIKATPKLPDMVVQTYEKFCQSIETFPSSETDSGWIEKLEAIEDHFGSPQISAKQIGCAREVFWKLKQMTSPSPKWGRNVDRLYEKITAQNRKQDKDAV